MRIVINLILLVAIVLLGYLTYASIKAPISFKDELDRRESVVIRKLNEIRRAQNVYRDVTGGSFADSWEKLLDTLKEDRKSTRLNSSHVAISYAVFCLKKKKK